MPPKKGSLRSSSENSFECPLCSENVPDENAWKHISFECRNLLNTNETQEFGNACACPKNLYVCPLCLENVPEKDKVKHETCDCRMIHDNNESNSSCNMRSDSSELYQCPLCFESMLEKNKKRHEFFECKTLIEDYSVHLHGNAIDVSSKLYKCPLCLESMLEKDQRRHESFECKALFENCGVYHDKFSKSEGSLEVPSVDAEDCKLDCNKSKSSGVSSVACYVVEIVDSATGLCISSGRVYNGKAEIPVKRLDPRKKYYIQVKALKALPRSKKIHTKKDLSLPNRTIVEEKENLHGLAASTDSTNECPKTNFNQCASFFRSVFDTGLSAEDLVLSKKKTIDDKSENITKETARVIDNTDKDQKDYASSSKHLRNSKVGSCKSKALSGEVNLHHCNILPEKDFNKLLKLNEQKTAKYFNNSKNQQKYVKNFKFLSDFKFDTHDSVALSGEDNVYHTVVPEKNDKPAKLYKRKSSGYIDCVKDENEYGSNFRHLLSNFKFSVHKTRSLSSEDNAHCTTLSEKNDEESEKVHEQNLSGYIADDPKNEKEYVSSNRQLLPDFKLDTHETGSSEDNMCLPEESEKKSRHNENCAFELEPGEPGPPGLPEIQAYDADFVELKWDFPVRDGGASITKYIIEKKDEYSPEWVPVKEVEGDISKAKVNGLNEGDKYEFRVIAVNTAGPGEPSQSSSPHLAKSKNYEPGPPGLPEIQDYDTDFVKLKWDLPVRDGGSSITGHIIEKKDKYSPEWVIVKEVEGDISKAKVTVLNEGDKYEFRVRAVNKVGASEPSESAFLHFSKPKDYATSCVSLKDLFLSGEDCDVMIEVKGKKFEVHRAILKALSPVLSTMFPHDMGKNSAGVISKVDCNPISFREFLLFIYSGNILSDENVTSVYYIANKYELSKLEKECVQYMRNALSSNSICNFIYLASKYDEHQLLEEATKFFIENVEEILVTSNWKQFLQENYILANELLIETFKTAYIKKQ